MSRPGECLYVVQAMALAFVVWAQSAEEAVQMARSEWRLMGVDEEEIRVEKAAKTGVVGAWVTCQM